MSELSALSLSLYARSNLVSSLIFIGLAIVVSLRGKDRDSGRLFSLWCISISIWAFGVSNQTLAADPGSAWRWSRVLHGSAAFIPVLFLHFILCYLNRVRRPLILSLYLLGFGFFLAAVTPSTLLIKDVSPILTFRFYPKAGPAYPAFFIFFSACVLYGFYELWNSYKSACAIRRNQTLYLLIGAIIGFGGGSTAFFPVFDIPIFPYGNYGLVVVCASSIAYAVVKHRLMDLPVALTRGLTYGALFALILAPTYLAILFLIRVFTGTMEYGLSAILLATFAILTGRMEALHKRMEQAVAKTVFRERYEAYETLTAFSKSLVTILDWQALTKEIVRTLVNAIGTNTASLYFLDKEKGAYVVAASQGLEEQETPRIMAGDELPHHLTSSQSVLLREEVEQSAESAWRRSVLNALTAMGSEICIPLINKDRLIGFCTLGPRANFRLYSEEDLELLTALAQNAAIALDNAMLYEQLRRSQILMRRTDRLRSLETIAGGFAHEIRNPLTSIKTFVQLAPERKNDPDFMGFFSRVVAEDVERIERLIREILDYARYMEPTLAEEDLNEVVESCLYFIQVKAGGHSITIVKDLAPGLPRVRLDRQQIKQVLLNLFLNAVEAMADRGGRLTVKTHRLIKSTGEPWVQVEVADTGPGIPVADLEHIFDPFYTTKHQSEEREGTGLGLTIVHQIIQEHRGYIEVNSEVGCGTTFFVSLPVNPALLERRRSREQQHAVGHLF